MHSLTSTPFARGYQSFRCERLIQIIYEDYCEPCYRPLHDSQVQLPDHDISRQPCIFNDDFVLITRGQTLVREAVGQCTDDGTVVAVVYTVIADHFGQSAHLGDYPSEEAAQAVITQLTFATGHYSRSWEISSAHLPPAEFKLLEERTWRGIASGFFECFELFDSHAIGCKLYSTPWQDGGNCPECVASRDEVLARLRDEQISPVLTELLLLAGQADVRFLVFDPDARRLPELPIFPDD